MFKGNGRKLYCERYSQLRRVIEVAKILSGPRYKTTTDVWRELKALEMFCDVKTVRRDIMFVSEIWPVMEEEKERMTWRGEPIVGFRIDPVELTNTFKPKREVFRACEM